MNLLGVLLAHRIRRDRVQLLLWVLGTAALAFMAIAAVVDTFGDRAERESILRLTILAPAILVFRVHYLPCSSCRTTTRPPYFTCGHVCASLTAAA